MKICLAIVLTAVLVGSAVLADETHQPTTQPAPLPASRPKRVFDGLAHYRKPDLRPFGLEPLYIAYDGTLNRATGKELPNNFPTADGRNIKAVEFAFRRVARAAAGVEADIPDHRRLYWVYERVPQFLCFDLEDPGYRALDATADPHERKALVERLSKLLDLVKAEQRMSGVEPTPGLGIFMWPPAQWGLEHPLEVSRLWRQDLAQKDLAPLVERVDAFFPECYVHSDNYDAWEAQLHNQLDMCRQADPQKPVYVFLAPHYAHYADPTIRWKELPADLWRRVLSTTLERVDGVVLWGGNDLTDQSGMRLLRWDDEAAWWQVVLDVMKQFKNKP